MAAVLDVCVHCVYFAAGFRYDANCPAYFVDDLELCAIKHIYSQNSLEFRTDNDLVAMTTDRASITDACRWAQFTVRTTREL